MVYVSLHGLLVNYFGAVFLYFLSFDLIVWSHFVVRALIVNVNKHRSDATRQAALANEVYTCVYTHLTHDPHVQLVREVCCVTDGSRQQDGVHDCRLHALTDTFLNETVTRYRASPIVVAKNIRQFCILFRRANSIERH